MIKLNIRFIKRIYGTDGGNYSVFAAETVDAKGSRLVEENKYGNISITGEFSIDESEMGQILKVSIIEDTSGRYPNSYKLDRIHYEFPNNAEEQWEYLKNSNIVPFSIYLAIKKAFKKTDKIVDIIIDNPERLTVAKGVGESRARRYQEKLIKNADRAAIFAEYGAIEGVGFSIIRTLVDWKPSVKETIKAIKKDPFSLLENPNIGFLTADKFREHYNIALNDENRILHGVSYFLNEKFRETGNTYEDVYVSAKFASSKLFVSYHEILNLLGNIKDNPKKQQYYGLKIFLNNISTLDLYNSELLIYTKNLEMIKDKSKMKPKNIWQQNKEEYLLSVEQELSSKQNEFLDNINNNRVSILLGPGGSGKSWVADIACGLINKAGLTYGLYAPTARAAHVMTEYIGTEASTIHRGLMKFAETYQTAPYDVLIIDEYSMVDSELAAVVLKTIGTNTRLIIIGDDYQLQSVGPGNVLFDLVNFLEVPTIRFDKIFRQKKNSNLLNYADDLREGVFNLPTEVKKVDDGDIVFINESNETEQRNIAMKLYAKALKTNSVDEIMMLTPVNNGLPGRKNLNKEVQAIVNPYNKKYPQIEFGANLESEEFKRYFRKDDYITVKKNQYEMIDDKGEVTEIINGDLGKVEYCEYGELTFSINDHLYTIDKSEINELIDHTWATTIHKAQGGQANEVIIVLPYNCYFMLNSNMLYTAITRTKLKCTVIGDFESINKAAKKQANYNRKTMIQLQGIGKQKRIDREKSK